MRSFPQTTNKRDKVKESEQMGRIVEEKIKGRRRESWIDGWRKETGEEAREDLAKHEWRRQMG